MSRDVRSLSVAIRIAVLRMLCFACAILCFSQAFAQVGFAASFFIGRPGMLVPGRAIWGGYPGVAQFGAPWGGYPGAALFGAPWGCYPGWGGCFGALDLRLMLERQRRFDALRYEPVVDPLLATTGLWRVPPYLYLPPPTPVEQIQPAYRERSVIRPEFRGSGEPIQ